MVNKSLMRTSLILLLSATLQAFAQLPALPLFSGSGAGPDSLISGLVAAWNFDEKIANGNRTDVNGLIWYDKGLTGSERGLMGGAVSLTNNVNAFLSVTNTAVFGLNSSFTMSAWVSGGNGGSSHIGQTLEPSSAVFDYQLSQVAWIVTDAGNSTHSINRTLTFDGLMHLAVVGYDAANSRIFYSLDGDAAQTAACGSVRQTANMPFRNNYIFAAVDSVYFWNRVLTSAEITRLYNSSAGFKAPFTDASASAGGVNAASSYNYAVYINGGSDVSSTTSNAVVTWANGYITDSLWAGEVFTLGFAPDGLTAAITPIKTPYLAEGGNNYIYAANTVNNNFVGGDLTINGLTGDAASKYLDTSINVNNTFGSSYDDCGITLYAYVAQNGAGARDAGCYVISGGNNRGFFMTCFAQDKGTEIMIGGESDFANVVPGKGNGFYSGSRTANARSDIYFANSGTAISSVANSTVARTESAPNGNAYVFAINIPGFGIFGYTSDTISAFSLNRGRDSTKTTASYNRWQQFRTDLGGGFR